MQAAMPMPTGSLEAYIQTVNRFPILTAPEERALAVAFATITTWTPPASWCFPPAAGRCRCARLPRVQAPHADLIQEGTIGLMKAVKRFDPERNVRLVSFAIHWIKAEIHEYILRNWRLVKLATTKAQRKLFFNLRSMKTGLAPMTSKEVKRIASELRVKLEEVVEMETRLGPGDRLRGRRGRRGRYARCITSPPTATPSRSRGSRQRSPRRYARPGWMRR